MKRLRDLAGFVVLALVMTAATVISLPALGWTAETSAEAVGAGMSLAPTLRAWMTWVVDNQALIGAFAVAVTGIVAAVLERRGRTAATAALDLVTTSAEIAENTRPRECRALKRQVEASAPTLGALAGRALMESINRARARR